MDSIVFNSYFIEFLFKLGLILLVYFVVMRFVLPFLRNERWHDAIAFYLPVVRNFALIFLVIEVAVTFGGNHPLLVIGILAGLIVLLWGYIRELFYGTVFKLQRGQLKGQRIKVEEFSGKIIGLNNTKLELETEKGEILQIPYSKVVNNVEIKPSAAKFLKTCTLTLEVAESKFKELEREVVQTVARMPYVVDSVMPKVEVVDQNKDQIVCKVVVYTNDDRFVPFIKSKLLHLSVD